MRCGALSIEARVSKYLPSEEGVPRIIRPRKVRVRKPICLEPSYRQPPRAEKATIRIETTGSSAVVYRYFRHHACHREDAGRQAGRVGQGTAESKVRLRPARGLQSAPSLRSAS